MTVANVLELVARMRRDAFSRNRNFDAFARANAEATRARRLWRFLRSLERDLVELAPGVGEDVKVAVERRGDGGRRITIEVPAIRFRRIAVMSAEEYALLRDHEQARSVLDAVENAA